ncbi:TetR/AcrR family transcriptional regulator [Priestia flexa]
MLQAAEQAYVEEGSNFSLRTITQIAKVNVAAVNYYFGSKTNLMELMAERIIGQLNAEQLSNLATLKKEIILYQLRTLLSHLLSLFFTSISAVKKKK